MLRDRVIERLVDQRGFSGTRHTGHAHQQPDRKTEVYALEIVAARAQQAQRVLGLRLVAQARDGDLPSAGQILGGE